VFVAFFLIVDKNDGKEVKNIVYPDKQITLNIV